MKYMITVIILALITFIMIGCTNNNNNAGTNQNITSPNVTEQSKEASTSTEEVFLKKISAADAKEMIDAATDLIILDVRTSEEFEEGHIKDAILIPDYEIETKAKELLTDKNATILVYCRSGRRSALASQTLSDLGYTSIYDFGGIIDWPYEVITD